MAAVWWPTAADHGDAEEPKITTVFLARPSSRPFVRVVPSRQIVVSGASVPNVQCPMPSVTVLSVADLRKQYGQTVAVDGISFDVRPGEIVGLLGPNGAGKTTTINMILGVLQPDAGTIRIEGWDLKTTRREALERANFAAVYAPLPGNLTVWQNLRFFGLLYGVCGLDARIESLLERFDLGKFRRVKSGLLSSGEQTRLSIAKAMLNRPHLLLLDEPTASLDPASARDIRRHIRTSTAEGEFGVLWTSHNMYEVEEVCDRVLFVSHGRVLLEGAPSTLARDHGKRTLEELFISVAREPLSFERD
jgi:ABC-2 type transport system ATP-binding protein